jgi:hypothetical protein
MQSKKPVVHHNTHGVGTVQSARLSDDGNHVVLTVKFFDRDRPIYAEPQFWSTPEAELLRIADSLLPVIPHSEPTPERTPVYYHCPDCNTDYPRWYSHPWTGKGQQLENNSPCNPASWRCFDCRKSRRGELSIARSKAFRMVHKSDTDFKARERERLRTWRKNNREHVREYKRQTRAIKRQHQEGERTHGITVETASAPPLAA